MRLCGSPHSLLSPRRISSTSTLIDIASEIGISLQEVPVTSVAVAPVFGTARVVHAVSTMLRAFGPVDTTEDDHAAESHPWLLPRGLVPHHTLAGCHLLVVT